MSKLVSLSLFQFKNHLSLKKELQYRIVAITGKNGVGKTNILDAIYYLCYGKSYFAKSDKLVPHFNGHGLRVEGTFKKDVQTNVTTIIIREDGKKELYVNQELLKRNAELLAYNSCVMIAPDDIKIINDSSEERRKYLDTILCQIDDAYLEQLIYYNKTLLHRNALLKQLAEQRQTSSDLLFILNTQLSNSGTYIFDKRNSFFKKISEETLFYYKSIANTTDNIELLYQSQLHNQNLLDLLNASNKLDIANQRTSVGVHKDDIKIQMKEELFKHTASQGQKKSLLLALKFTELTLLKTIGKKEPILLLDDIMERLDNQRLEFLFSFIHKEITNMVLVTDVDANRFSSIIQPITNQYQIWELE